MDCDGRIYLDSLADARLVHLLLLKLSLLYETLSNELPNKLQFIINLHMVSQACWLWTLNVTYI